MYRVTGSDRDYEPGHVFHNFFMWLLLTSRFDRVYYGNRLEDTKSDMDLEPLFQFVAAPIDQRSTPAEQVRSKEAYDVIKKWANDPNGFIICCDQKNWRTLMETIYFTDWNATLSCTHCGNVVTCEVLYDCMTNWSDNDTSLDHDEWFWDD